MSTHAPENVRLPSPTPSESELFSGKRDEALTQPRIDNNASSPPANNSSSNETTVPLPTPAHMSLDPAIIDALSALSTEAPVRTYGRRRSSSASTISSDIPMPPRRQPRQPVQAPISTRIRRALGLANPKASLIWHLTFGTSVIIVIGVLLGLSSKPGSIPPDVRPLVIGGFDMSQWQACDRPLVAWNIVWAVKAFLGLGMAAWEYMRAIRPSMDQLLSVERARLRREVRRARRNNRNLERTGQAPNSSTGPTSLNGPISPRSLPPQWTTGVRREDDLDMIEATRTGSAGSIEIVRNMRRIRAKREYEERWYSRCSSFQVLYGLVWFATANILIYGSLTTCRYTSPYIWWLTFSLLCLGYLVVAEMVLVALVVFVIGPLVYVAINIVLVCMGRRPIRPGVGMAQINPDVPKMPRTMVDRIPLVMYIPTTTATEATAPEPAHVYPPQTSKPTPAATKRRFFFFRKRVKSSDAGQEKNKPDDVEAAEWEKNEYPFVKLEANRAACAICLTDFEPPRKVGQEGESAAEPLRLLACGHVFHKECIDPWLVDVSGRCPTCQRPIEEGDLDPEEGSKKNKRRWRRRR
ncbi:zinc-RING finger protein [Rhizoctonia solani AG-3 Rhs1AP]|uniref:Zinc-RING finger protein n=1 Tax=Rhizoctonia solani AG-3 Rhs1AP TaxID=1086054 RepID=X8IX94_9AGAM|nr:zinc-RING finger protein [Rhizoctonia solani AG-3 Rhs1AP]